MMMTDAYGSIELQWQLVSHGAAIFSLNVNDNQIDVSTTYVGDSFSEILRAAADVKVGSEATFAVLAGEPRGGILFLSRAGDQLYLRLVSFNAMSVSMNRLVDGKLRWHGLVSVEGFVDAVIIMANNVHSVHGSQDFERLWGHPFPSARLEKLCWSAAGS